MEQNLTKVRIEDFNISELRKAACEGRLFIAPANHSEEEEQQKSIEEILTYVSAINDCAAPDFQMTIASIWKAILSDVTLRPLFLLNRYASTRNQPNWYRVTAVVLALHENNIYKTGISVLDLHLRMEHTNHRTNRYNGMNRYLLVHNELCALRRILVRFGWENK